MTIVQSHKTTTKFVYSFGRGLQAPPLDKALLGGKGKGLAEMASISLPVPPGFIISTEACTEFQAQGKHFPVYIQNEVKNAMKVLESQMGAEFGNERNPLLVSVRSGARVSMPGMMDTILNLGLNDRSVLGFIEVSKNEKLAYDNYRRFIMMYAEIVEAVPRKLFTEAFEELKKKRA